MELDVHRKDEESQEEEVKEPKSFTMQEMTRGFSLFERHQDFETVCGNQMWGDGWGVEGDQMVQTFSYMIFHLSYNFSKLTIAHSSLMAYLKVAK